MTNPRPLLIGQFGVFPGRHVEIRRGFELCGVLFLSEEEPGLSPRAALTFSSCDQLPLSQK